MARNRYWFTFLFYFPIFLFLSTTQIGRYLFSIVFRIKIVLVRPQGSFTLFCQSNYGNFFTRCIFSRFTVNESKWKHSDGTNGNCIWSGYAAGYLCTELFFLLSPKNQFFDGDKNQLNKTDPKNFASLEFFLFIFLLPLSQIVWWWCEFSAEWELFPSRFLCF